MMKKRKINIPALLLLFSFLLGTIGVNVSKVYCHRCQETYSHVMFIPADVPCPCMHDCVCRVPQYAQEKLRQCEATAHVL